MGLCFVPIFILRTNCEKWLKEKRIEKKTMRGKSADTYQTLLRHYNKTVPKLVVCECGKITGNMERHLATGTHKLLLHYKQQYESMTRAKENEKENEPLHPNQPPSPKRRKKQSIWHKVVHNKDEVCVNPQTINQEEEKPQKLVLMEA